MTTCSVCGQPLDWKHGPCGGTPTYRITQDGIHKGIEQARRNEGRILSDEELASGKYQFWGGYAMAHNPNWVGEYWLSRLRKALRRFWRRIRSA